MQNQVSATSTTNVISSINSNMIELQTVKSQPQKYYAVDMSTFSHKFVNASTSSSYITLQPGHMTQFLPDKNDKQMMQIQLANGQFGSNLLNIQSQSQTSNVMSSNGQRFIAMPANLLSNNQSQNLNQQKVSIQLLQHSNQQQFPTNQQTLDQHSRSTAVSKKNSNIQVSLNYQTIQVNDGVQLRPVLFSPQHNSLVGSVSVAQPTPIVHLNDLVQRAPDQKGDINEPSTSQELVTQQLAFIQASPKKQGSKVESSSLFQAFQQAAQATATPLNTSLDTRLPTKNVQTVFSSLKPYKLTIQSGIQQQGQKNPLARQQVKLEDTSGFHGTIMVVNNDHTKKKTLAPKIVQVAQGPMFVPITMANNLSLLPNQHVSMPHKATNQLGSSTTLRIQQQIAPRVSSIVTTNTDTTNNGTQQKIFIPVQPATDHQQYIIQTVPQNLTVTKSQLCNNYQTHQRKDLTTSVVTLSKYTKTSSTSSVGSITDTKPLKKPCNCTKSQCLKLYCECFSNGEFCNNCNCRTCHNTIEHEAKRSRAVKACLERNPYAFHPKIGKGKVKGDNERRHTKGCNCKRSGCLKNYCECYEAKILCSSLCKCSGCKNFEESADRQTLMHLADAAEVRVQQQNAAKSKLAAQLNTTEKRITSKEKLPYTFMTADVSRATCDVLLAAVQETQMLNLADEKAEYCVLEEFSRSLNQIIEKSNIANSGRR